MASFLLIMLFIKEYVVCSLWEQLAKIDTFSNKLYYCAAAIIYITMNQKFNIYHAL